MNNNGMIKYKENVISKFRNFFKKIFEKQKYSNVQENNINQNVQEKKDNFADILKVDEKLVNTVVEKNKFLKEIEGNEEALNMLSIERLKKLDEYYESIIKQNNEKIKRLKN